MIGLLWNSKLGIQAVTAILHFQCFIILKIALCQCDTETFIKPIYFAQQFKGQKLIEPPALNFYNVST